MKLRIYKTGLHFGEESVVPGNDRAGMVVFSGCHLACNFCYTPETSVHSMGRDVLTSEFEEQLESLLARGARNINLISPTHVWNAIEPSLHAFKGKHPHVPLVLKVSGYEKKPVAARMAAIADVLVPDFKVFSREAAARVNLPLDYGTVARDAIALMSEQGRFVLVRHLLMPDFVDDSLSVLRELGKIRFGGYLNLMTHFLHPKRGLVSARAEGLERMAREQGIKVLINGEERHEDVG